MWTINQHLFLQQSFPSGCFEADPKTPQNQRETTQYIDLTYGRADKNENGYVFINRQSGERVAIVSTNTS